MTVLEKRYKEVREPVSRTNARQISRAKKNHVATLWHIREAHLSCSVVSHMMSVMSYRMTINKEMAKLVCDTCIKIKQFVSSAVGHLANNAEKITVYKGTCGTFQIQTIKGKQYFFALTTTPHRYKEVQLLRHKNEVVQHLQDYIA